jgi:hypothetical protein
MMDRRSYRRLRLDPFDVPVMMRLGEGPPAQPPLHHLDDIQKVAVFGGSLGKRGPVREGRVFDAPHSERDEAAGGIERRAAVGGPQEPPREVSLTVL